MRLTRITIITPLGVDPAPYMSRAAELAPGIPVDARHGRKLGLEFNGGDVSITWVGATYDLAKKILAHPLQ